MSVRERVDRLRLQAIESEQQRRLEEEQQRAEAQRLLAERHHRWQENLPDTIGIMERLYKNLERRGVISMIEDGSGVAASDWLSPLFQPQTPTGPSPRDLLKLKGLTGEEVAGRLLGAASREWWVSILPPQFSPEPTYPSITIHAKSGNPLLGLITSNLDQEIRSWQVDYSVGILGISGEQIQYQGGIPVDRAQRFEVLETALAKAIVNPKVTKPLPESRGYMPDRFGEPAS